MYSASPRASRDNCGDAGQRGQCSDAPAVSRCQLRKARGEARMASQTAWQLRQGQKEARHVRNNRETQGYDAERETKRSRSGAARPERRIMLQDILNILLPIWKNDVAIITTPWIMYTVIPFIGYGVLMILKWSFILCPVLLPSAAIGSTLRARR